METTTTLVNGSDAMDQTQLRRALIVGIGGSGAEVLLRLRRLLVDKYGSLDRIPSVRFLYIDTEMVSIEKSQGKIEKSIHLKEGERVDAGIPDASAIYRNIGEGLLPNYAWFSSEKLKMTNITDGAGQIRQYGRLCFWHNAAKFRAQIDATLTELELTQVEEDMKEWHGIQLAKGIEVHLVAGLAGGTGSGMFLDAAYLLKSMLERRKVEGAKTLGYLMLPGAFTGICASANANGYAALKELNYYSYQFGRGNRLATIFGQPTWEADYEQIPNHAVRLQKAPFDYCYLFDKTNGVVNFEKEHVFAMVARSLCFELDPSISGLKRRMRDNVQKKIATGNDPIDCPQAFMSFGQSAILFPRTEVETLFTYQLAIRALRQWLDQGGRSFNLHDWLSTAKAPDAKSKDFASEVMASVGKCLDAVNLRLGREILDDLGLREVQDILVAVTTEHKQRITDLPVAFKEAEKGRWIAEDWPADSFVTRLDHTFRTWKRGFSVTGPNPEDWGENVRGLDTRRRELAKGLSGRIRQLVLRDFNDTQRFGPAYAICLVQRLRAGLGKMKDLLLSQASDAILIAEILGNVYLVTKAGEGGGNSLSSIIDERAGQELQKLDEVSRAFAVFGKKERVRAQADIFLTWCSDWCRAQVEERSRRAAAQLCESLIEPLLDLERELVDTVQRVGHVQQNLLKLAQDWSQKAMLSENNGRLLYKIDREFQDVWNALETNVAARNPETYNPAKVAQRALERLGKRDIQELDGLELPRLIEALLAAAKEAVGSLSESGDLKTVFAAYDLVSELYPEDRKLESILKEATEKCKPFVQLRDNPPGENFKAITHLKSFRGVGMVRGNTKPEDDQDEERKRVVKTLQDGGWRQDEFYAIGDSSQILFVHEIGGFPLRALSNIEVLYQDYEQHRGLQPGIPMHVMRDEFAASLPDIVPPGDEQLKMIRRIQTVGVILGVVSPIDTTIGSITRKVYSYIRKGAVRNRNSRIDFGETLESIGIHLVRSPELVKEIGAQLAELVAKASPVQKQGYYEALEDHIDRLKAALQVEKQGVAPSDNDPALLAECDPIHHFEDEFGLVPEPVLA